MTLKTTFIAAIPLSFVLCLPANADRLSAAWQQQRDYYNAITDRACNGERQALEQLREAALDNMEPVAINNLAWLHDHPDSCPNLSMDRDTSFAGDLYRDSANMLYPVGMYNHGLNTFYGENGVTRSLGDGLSWLESAAMEGHASAARELALIYAEGRGGVSADFAPADYYYTLAERNGLPSERLARLASALDAAAEAGASGPVAGGNAGNGTVAAGGSGIPRVGPSDSFVLTYGARRLEDYPLGVAREMNGGTTITTVFYGQAFIDDEDAGCYYPGVFVMVEARTAGGFYNWDPASAIADSRRRVQNEADFSTGFTLETFPEAWDAIQSRRICVSCGAWVMSVTEADARFGGLCAQTSQPVVQPEPVWVE